MAFAEPILESVTRLLGDAIVGSELVRGQPIVTVSAASWLAAALLLRDSPELAFEQLIDLCGVDYQAYGNGRWDGRRFAVVVQLLSVSLNQRVRVKIFAGDDDFPSVDSVTDVWAGANWYEREAFDLLGIVQLNQTDAKWFSPSTGMTGYAFAGFIFWIFCFSMSRYSVFMERRLETGHRR